MSQSTQTSPSDASKPTLGSRENFFDKAKQDYQRPEEETLTGPRRTDVDRDWGVNHSFVRGKSKAEYVAYNILRDSATILCPVSLHAPPDRGLEPLFEYLFGDGDEIEHDPTALHRERGPVELTKPTLHVPKEFPEMFSPRESGQYRLQRRYNKEYGYVSFGGKIANRSFEEFMEVVDEVLDWVVSRDDSGLERDDVEGIRRGAFQMKKASKMDDVDILEEVVSDIIDATDGQ